MKRLMILLALRDERLGNKAFPAVGGLYPYFPHGGRCGGIIF